ncbi:hypothetical protein V3390_09405 [Luteimonas sp. FXH3W]|uniref:Uncharacterized protein n=1 Tax=Aquilutibacter rugosus TaxID=3115820 RepID=A0ABU7V0Z8_9GAMM
MDNDKTVEYSQGIMGDGAAILKDGVRMTVDEIVSELNAHAREVEALRQRVEAAEARYERLLSAGSQLSDIAFNLSQCGGDTLAASTCRSMDNARRSWDDAIMERNE